MPAIFSAPRHRAERRSLLSVRSVIATAGAIALGTVAAAALSGGTLALWSDSSSTAAPTLTAAKFGITAAESWNDTLFTNLLVGETVRQSFTVTNTGDIPATITGTATASAAYEIRYATGACTTTVLTGTSATTATKALGTLAAGATASYCLELKVATTATAASTQAFTATIGGAQ